MRTKFKKALRTYPPTGYFETSQSEEDAITRALQAKCKGCGKPMNAIEVQIAGESGLCHSCVGNKQQEVTGVKNPWGKMRPPDKPYETWTSHDGTWTWDVLKKWQVDDNKPYARWFCMVKSPFVPEGEMGDVYVSEIKSSATKTFDDGTGTTGEKTLTLGPRTKTIDIQKDEGDDGQGHKLGRSNPAIPYPKEVYTGPFNVVYWIDEEHRSQGESDLFGTFELKAVAFAEAKRLYERESYPAVEVVNRFGNSLKVFSAEGTEGQDRESYTDTQDRESYTVGSVKFTKKTTANEEEIVPGSEGALWDSLDREVASLIEDGLTDDEIFKEVAVGTEYSVLDERGIRSAIADARKVLGR